MATEFYLLGPIEVVDAGGPVSLGGARQRAVLATLALHTGRIVTVERLISVLWGTAPPNTARQQIFTCVSSLRRVFGESIVTRSPGYVLVAECASIDLQVFEAQVTRGRESAATDRPEEAVARFRAALRLWRGYPLAGVSGLKPEAAKLEQRRLAVLAECIDLELKLQRYGDVIAELFEIVATHPLHEGFYAQLMKALYAAGRAAEALALYRRARATVVEELGLEPGLALRQLERAILTGAPPRGLTLGNAGSTQLRVRPAPPRGLSPRTRSAGRKDLIGIFRLGGK